MKQGITFRNSLAALSLQLGLMNVVAAVMVDRQAQARLEDEKLQYQIRSEELQKSYTFPPQAHVEFRMAYPASWMADTYILKYAFFIN